VSQQINLFNPIFLQQKKIFSARTMAQALGVLVVGLAAIQGYGGMRVDALEREASAGAAQLAAREARLAMVKKEFVPRQKSAAVDAELAEAERQLADLREVSGVLDRGELGNTQGYAEYFRALARQHQDGLWLTGVSISGAGTAVGVRGRALDPQRVPAYLNRLTQEPVMRGKHFGSMQIGKGAPLTRVDGDGKSSTAPAPYVEFSLGAEAQAVRP
jgi:hypothetical protein